MLLMQALQATGRQAEALRHARRYREQLAEETGLEPSSQLDRHRAAVVAGGRSARRRRCPRPAIARLCHARGRRRRERSGRVYAATQPGTERQVAIKAIRPDVADDAEFVRRFDAEAQLVARLEHPHIVPLYDYWREPGAAYLVFRLVSGGSARNSVLAGGPWSLPRVSRLIEEIGGALMVAHAAGVVHHDVKATNVLLDTDGSAYLTDFGIAVASIEAGDVDVDVRQFGWLRGSCCPVERISTGRGRRCRRAERTRFPRVSRKYSGARRRRRAGMPRSPRWCWRGVRWSRRTPARLQQPTDQRLAVDSARRQAALRLARSTAAGINPYKGLRPFDEADAAAFFGRAGVVDELHELVGIGAHGHRCRGQRFGQEFRGARRAGAATACPTAGRSSC